MTSFTLTINKHQQTVEAEDDMPLLWVLRDLLKLTGTKFGCGIGLCGACTIHLDGIATRACMTPISSVGQQAITTIEGLATDGDHPLQQAWLAEGVPQCGYCQAGQLMSAAALLAENPKPNNDDINQAMSGNLCRCGTYRRIRQAIQRAAEEM